MTSIKKLISLTLSLLTLLSAPAFAQSADTASTSEYRVGDTYSLTIMHTHDIHGYVDNVSRYATYVHQVEQSVDNMLLLDGGDTFRRGEFDEYRGIVEAQLFNIMDYDACTLGNNDFNVPADKKDAADCNEMLSDIVDATDAPIVCANVVYSEDGDYLDGVEPYTIVEKGGVRIGIIGLTSMKPAERSMPEVADKEFLDAVDSLTDCLDQLEGQTDINIVLSHAGIIEDMILSQLAQSPELGEYNYKFAAILSADDHLMLSKPLCFNYGGQEGIPIFQHGGGSYNTLGRLDLEFEVTEDGFQLTSFNGCICDVSDMKPNDDIEALIAKYRAEIEKAKAEKTESEEKDAA